MKYLGKTLTWKKDYGDGEITDDAVLWVNKEPTEIVISGAECGWYGVLYYGNTKLYIADTRKELKEALFTEFKDILNKVVKG